MSFSATPERPVAHESAYPLELRWAYIVQHLSRCLRDNIPPRCGLLAAAYGGGMITKADIQQRWASMNELGSGK